MTAPIAQSMDTLSSGRSSTAPFITLNMPRQPTVNDMSYKTGQRWIDTSAQNAEWYLLSFEAAEGVVEANWVQLGSGSATTETLSGNTGDVVFPNGMNNIFVLGNEASGITFDGNLSSQLTATLEDIPNSSLLNSSITLVAAGGISITTSPVSLGGSTTISTNETVLRSLSDDVNAPILPAASNIQLVGHVNEQGGGKFSTVKAGTNLANINPMSTYRWIVDPLGFNGTHTTIASAMISATAGDIIFVMAGTYTENITLKDEVTIYGSGTQSTFIVGKCTYTGPITGTGNAFLREIALITNSDYVLSVTGPNICNLSLSRVFVVASNHTAFQFTNSNPASSFLCDQLTGTTQTTGITLYEKTCPGNLIISFSDFLNNGSSLTPSTNSAGSVAISNSRINVYISGSNSDASGYVIANSTIGGPLAVSNTAGLNLMNCQINLGLSGDTVITQTDSSYSNISNCFLLSTNGTILSVGTGALAIVTNNTVSSTATNIFTGGGTIRTGGNACVQSSGNNVATIVPLTLI